MTRDEPLPALNRRTLLKSVGAGIAASAMISPSVAEPEYDTVVDIVEAGADNTGQEPIDDVFHSVARDDTRIEFPEGRYKVNDITVYKFTNLAMVGTGDAVLVPGEDYDPRLWIAGTNNRNLRFENFTIDNTEEGVGPTLNLHAYDGLVVRNVTKIGHHDVDRPGFGFRIIEEDGVGLVEDLRAADGGVSVGIYTDPAGTITYRNCHIEGFADNGIYGVYGDGPVHIDGGLYKNNNVTSLRLSNPGSTVTGATIVVEDPPEAFSNCRGIRISDGPGPVHVQDCEIRMVRGRGTGGIVCEGSGGSFTVRDTAIGVGEEYTVRTSTERTSYGIYVGAATNEVGTRTIENTVIKGRGTDLAAVRIARDNNELRNVCIEQAGDRRSGVLFLGCHGNVVEDSSITAPDEQIRLDGDSTVERRNVSTDTICQWPTSDTTFDGDTITIAGKGTTAHYEFSVGGAVEKATTYGGTLNGYDEIRDDGRVTGRTTNDPDSFTFTGDLLDFDADAPVDVSINGDEVDPATIGSDTITILGNGTTAYYEFSVEGAVEKSTEYGGTINGYDEIRDDGRVTGRTTNDPDSFAFTGTLLDFDIDGDANVLFNGDEIDPALLGASVITIVGQGTTAHYEFTVEGAVEKSTEYDGTINDFDAIHYGGRVTGRTTSDPDSYLCTGVITSFAADEPVDVSVNGNAVDLN